MEPNELIAPPLSSNERRFIIVLLLIALAVRLYVFFHTYVIAIDGVFYIKIAEEFASGDFAAGLNNYYPPFYSLCIAAFSFVIPDFEIAGQTVSLIFGMILFIPVYLMARDNFGPRIAQITALLFAFQDQLVKYSSQVRTESTYYALAALGIYFGWRGIQNRKLFPFFLCGLFAALAYLTRPEGIGIFLIVGFWLFFDKIRQLKKEILFKLAAYLLLVAPAVIFALPFVIAITPSGFGHGGEGAGELKISRKKSFSAMLGLDRIFRKYEIATAAGEDAEEENRDAEGQSEFVAEEAGNVALAFLGRLWRLFLNFIEDYNPLLFALALLALFRRKNMFYIPKFEWFIFAFFIMYLSIFALVRTSHRHPTQLIPFTLFWAAIGVAEVHYLLLVKFMKGGSLSAERLSARITHIILIILIVLLAAETLKPRRFERLPVKYAGAWIKDNSSMKPRIGSNEYRVGFYAGASEIINVYRIDAARRKLEISPAMIKNLVEGGKVDYIALEKTTATPESFEAAAALSCIREVKVFKLPDGVKGQEVHVYAPATSACPLNNIPAGP